MSLRANVTNMTVPGDYVFQINVTNPGHPDLTAQIICTVNPASSPPVISSITATPPSVTLPANSIQLSAITSGSTNQPLRHWWAVKTVPAGAQPQFDHQGATNTTVSNLNLPGNYTFTLRAFDDLHMTTQDKTITVSAAPGAPVITSAAAATVIVGTPFTYTITAAGNLSGFSAANYGVIAANGSVQRGRSGHKEGRVLRQHSQPSALGPQPCTIAACACSCRPNRFRPEAPKYYQIVLQQDLLGGWTLTREWGQQGGRVSVKREVYLEGDDALSAFERAHDAQVRRGYHVMFSQGMESPYAVG